MSLTFKTEVVQVPVAAQAGVLINPQDNTGARYRGYLTVSVNNHKILDRTRDG